MFSVVIFSKLACPLQGSRVSLGSWDIIGVPLDIHLEDFVSIMRMIIKIQERVRKKCLLSKQILKTGMSTSLEQGAVRIVGYHRCSFGYSFEILLHASCAVT